MNDPTDRLDTVIRGAVRDLDVPPPTPREAMWARIEAARRPVVIPLRPRRSWPRWAVGLAAVLALGIGIGRWTMRQPGPGPEPAIVTAPDRIDRPAGPESPALPPADAPPQVADEPIREVAPPEAAVAALPLRPVPAARAPVRPAAPAVPPAPSTGGSTEDVYRLASVQMLTQAETLLTQFRAGGAAAPVDPQLSRWARDMLASTRLLLDSPAGRDRATSALLHDLELILVQIVQLSSGPAGAGEREMINETMESRDVLPRIRTAIPTGPARLGT